MKASNALWGLAFFATGFAWVVLPPTIGLEPDSASYLAGAQSLAQNRGYLDFRGMPQKHFPPLYSAALAALTPLPGDIRRHADQVARVLLGLNTLLMGYAVYAFTGGILVALSIQVIFLFSNDVLASHATALSEPLFLFWLLSGFIALQRFRNRPRRFTLMLAALCLGCSLLTRYAGIAWIGAGGLCLLFLAPEGWRQRLWTAGLFVFTASLPFGLWCLRNHIVGGPIVDRRVQFSLFSLCRHGPELLYTLRYWLLQEDPPAWAGAVLGVWGLGVGAAGLAAVGRARAESGALRDGALQTGLFIGSYAVLLVTTDVWFDNTPLDTRILLPVHALSLLLLAVVYKTVCFRRIGWRSLTASFLFISYGVYTVGQGVGWTQEVRAEGPTGLANPAWQHAGLYQKVETLPAGTRLYSNVPALIYFYAGRAAFDLPIKYDGRTFLAAPSYARRMRLLGDEVSQGKAVIVYFPRAYGYWQPTWRDIKQIAPDRAVLVYT